MSGADNVKCDKAHLRLIIVWYEPYCISGSREEPVPVAVRDRENWDNYCCSAKFRQCPFYHGRLFRRRIEPPADVN